MNMPSPESTDSSERHGLEPPHRHAWIRDEDRSRSYDAARFGVVACLLFMAGGLYWTAAIGLLTISALTAYPVMISIGVAFSMMIFGAAFWTPRGRFSAYSADSQSHASNHTGMSTYDSVTGLPTNRLFLSLLRQALIRAQQQGRQVAILMVELDHFTPIIDASAVMNCNLMYRIQAARVKSALCTTDTVARLGERTFAVLLEHVTDANEVLAIARKMQSTISLPVTLDEHELFLASRIGISLSTHGCLDIDTLVEAATQALVTARANSLPMYGLLGSITPATDMSTSTMVA